MRNCQRKSEMAHERILVVDDEIDLATSCQKLLNSRGYETEVAGTGEEALTRIKYKEPQLATSPDPPHTSASTGAPSTACSSSTE